MYLHLVVPPLFFYKCINYVWSRQHLTLDYKTLSLNTNQFEYVKRYGVCVAQASHLEIVHSMKLNVSNWLFYAHVNTNEDLNRLLSCCSCLLTLHWLPVNAWSHKTGKYCLTAECTTNEMIKKSENKGKTVKIICVLVPFQQARTVC